MPSSRTSAELLCSHVHEAGIVPPRYLAGTTGVNAFTLTFMGNALWVLIVGAALQPRPRGGDRTAQVPGLENGGERIYVYVLRCSTAGHVAFPGTCNMGKWWLHGVSVRLAVALHGVQLAHVRCSRCRTVRAVALGMCPRQSLSYNVGALSACGGL